MTKATEDQLGALHKLVAEIYHQELLKEEIAPALLTSAAKFLKDNDITAIVEQDSNLSAIDDLLKAKRNKRNLRAVK